jgi:hypothetical protein
MTIGCIKPTFTQRYRHGRPGRAFSSKPCLALARSSKMWQVAGTSAGKRQGRKRFVGIRGSIIAARPGHAGCLDNNRLL